MRYLLSHRSAIRRHSVGPNPCAVLKPRIYLQSRHILVSITLFLVALYSILTLYFNLFRLCRFILFSFSPVFVFSFVICSSYLSFVGHFLLLYSVLFQLPPIQFFACYCFYACYMFILFIVCRLQLLCLLYVFLTYYLQRGSKSAMYAVRVRAR